MDRKPKVTLVGTAPALDSATRKLLAQALEMSEQASNLSCGFFACPGPDKPFVGMATCYVCRTTQLLRRAVKRLGLEVAR